MSLEHIFRGWVPGKGKTFSVWGNSGIVSKYIACLTIFFSFITAERPEAWVLRLHAPVSFMVILLRLQCMHQFCASLGIRASHTTPNNLAVHFGHVFNFFQLQSSHWIFNKHCRSESILSFYHLILHILTLSHSHSPQWIPIKHTLIIATAAFYPFPPSLPLPFLLCLCNWFNFILF